MPDVESNDAFESYDIATQMVSTDSERAGYLARRLKLLEMSPGIGGHNPKLLDVGCSTGKLMALARQAGWTVAGVEMSQALAEQARQANPQAVVVTGDILEMNLVGLGSFDAIVALDVIEHVLDPDAFLQRLHALLVVGGQLLLHTPNAASLRSRLQGREWNMRIPEYHFHLFSPLGLRLLLERSGFHVQYMATASGSGTERGVRALFARAKEKILGAAKLGNALVLVAKKLPDSRSSSRQHAST